jgi:hypothetical protein
MVLSKIPKVKFSWPCESEYAAASMILPTLQDDCRLDHMEMGISWSTPHDGQVITTNGTAVSQKKTQ